MDETKTLTVILQHRSSIAGARWCEPVGWEPQNEIENAEFVDGGWWGDEEQGELAGLVCWSEGDEGEQIECRLDDLRVASTGDCRVIGAVRI